MGLIFLFSLPILSAWQGDTEMTNKDLLVAAVMLSLIIIQTIADEQQHKYQTKKYKLIRENKELFGNYKKGFIDTGLWKFSRHPNYTCEQLIWITFYIFSITSTVEPSTASMPPSPFGTEFCIASPLILKIFNVSEKFK